MSNHTPPGWLRSWVATNLASTVFASIGVSVGGILTLLAPYLGGERWFLFFVGSCIPAGPMAFIYTTDWMFERRLLRLKRWLDLGLVSPELYEEHRRRALDWRAERLYGKASTSRPQTEPRASKRSNDLSPPPSPPESPSVVQG